MLALLAMTNHGFFFFFFKDTRLALMLMIILLHFLCSDYMRAQIFISLHISNHYGDKD